MCIGYDISVTAEEINATSATIAELFKIESFYI